MNRKITLFLPLFVLGFLFTAQAQCPPNIDFESAGLADWVYWRGSCYSPGGVMPTYTFYATAPVPGLHTLTSSGTFDYYGAFPVVAPGGGLHSLKLGKDSAQYSTMKAAYNVHVPSGPGVYSFIYRYAVVLENPTGHTTFTEPRFIVAARDSITNNLVACDSFNYVGDGSEPGFLASSVTSTLGNGLDVTYKTWTMGNLKFPGEAGRTATIYFIAQGCTQSGHMCYGYVDMSCGFVADNIVTCASGTTTLSGPDGYSAYHWYDSLTFGTSYGTSQSVVVTSPTTTTTYAVILTPYSGYGCTDTLYTKVYPTSLTLHPTHDTTVCSGTAVTLSMGAVTPYSTPVTYIWGPSTGLSCVTCASPVATPSVSTNYYCIVTDSAGCQLTDTIHITVVSAPGPITGPLSVCQGQTITLSDIVPGGTWTSSNPAMASIAAVSGVVTGVAVGTTTTITYTLGASCRVTRGVTVTADPAAITGTATMCIGTCTTLADVTPGGTWSSTSGLISVTGSSGVVCGISAGTATVTYTVGATGCYVTRTVTVNPSPAAISGTSTVCVGGTLIVVDLTPGGTWSVSPTADGTVNPATGVITGISAGVLTVTYTLATGCATTTTVNVLPIPGPISGPTQVCIGDSITLTDPTPGGTWVASNANVAIPDPTTGLLIGEPVGGLDTISYTAGTSSCPSLYIVTINPFTSPINVTGGGPATLCVGQTLLLNDADPGVWSASNPLITTIGATTGLVNGIAPGSDTITFTNSLGCKATLNVTVNPLPLGITGPTSLCVGTTITLSDPTPGGTFTTTGVHASVTFSGTVLGLSVGTQMITYTSSLGCNATYMVTVNTTPPPISGVLSVCQGLTTVLSDGICGGIWTITPTTTATIIGTACTATVTGVNPGTATVTYALGVGCSTTAIVTVNPMPGAITPASPVVCVGSTVTLADPTSPGGTWTPVTGTNANINALTGVVTGISNGLQVFTYTSATGCIRPVTVNVNPLPLAIGGPAAVCVGSCITLTDGSGGGTWTSLSLTIGTIGATTGVFCGVSSGTATIKYQLPTGCATAAILTVNPIPPLCTMTPATGTFSYCAGGAGITIGLSCSSAGVNYTLKNGLITVATLPGTGTAISFGPQFAAGTYTIVASYPATGCSRNMTGSVTININPLPVITGPSALCVGATMTLTSSIPGSTWVSSAPLNASIGATSGIVTGITTGSTTVITCTAPATGCNSKDTISVTPSPTPITGASTVCVGDSTLFTDGVPGGTMTSGSTIIASVGSYTGYIYGVSPGTAVITYSLGSGCTQTKSITVIAQPAPITTVSGAPMVICQGASLPLHDGTTPGTWSIAPGSSALATISGGGVATATITGGTLQTQAAVVYTSTSTGCRNWAYVTINPLPAPIVGTFQVCQGLSTVLTDPTGSGTWSISTTAYATINATSGTLTGITAGSPSIVSYSVAGCSATAPVTVNALPGAITGTTHICTGDSLTLSSSSPGGMWSVVPVTTATINPTSGSIYGVVPGTAIVTYTLPTTCLTTKSVTVNQTPAPITGPAGVCVPNGASMTDATPGGTWSSTNPAIATIGAATGLITTGPTLTGSVTISYTVGTCAATTPFNVTPHPLAITGSPYVCVGSTTSLADATPGGTWSSGTPSLGSISTAGVVTGIASGTVIVSYGSPGCNSIAPVVVNPISPVIGDSIVCVGQTIGLTDGTVGGVWTSTFPSIATVSYTTGIVTGVSAATTGLVVYTIPATGCTASRTLTVNPVPASVTGPAGVCVGQTGIYHTASTGGLWSTSNPAVGTIDPTAGILTGISAGAINVTYTLTATTCFITYPVIINPLPSAISGPSAICVGSAANYTDASGIGTWISSTPAIASIGLTSGIAHAGMAPGTDTISFTLLATGCATAMPVSVINLPTSIYSSVPAVVCQGQSVTLYDTSGTGIWTGSSSSIANITTAGVVTGLLPGTDTITYSTGAGCVTPPFVVTVNAIPSAPTSSTGSFSLCEGQLLTLSSYPAVGTWMSMSPAFATVTSVTGVVTGIAAGSSVISYTLPTGCAISTIIFVNATPPAITGINTVCIGLTSPLADAAPGGTWTSSTGAATVSATGLVTGVSAGTTVISYTLSGTACPAMMPMTVNPVPGPITGANTVCAGQSITLSDAVPGTGWSSANTAIATVNTAGVVIGISGGSTTISYMLGAGCYVDTTVNVIALPAAIIGGDSVCQGQSLSFTDPTPSGAWTSTVPAVGNINPSTGVMLGVAAGTTTISYTVNGCSVFQPVTVDVQPAAITGNPIVCLGSTSALHDAVGGGVWSSSNSAVAPVSTSGVVFGSALGTATITYMHSPGACSSTMNVNVVPLPLVFNVTGGGSYCAEGSGVNIGLNGSSVGVNYMLYQAGTATGSFAGTGSPLGFGLQTVAGPYTVIGTSTSTGCSNNMAGSATVVIIPNLVPAVNITPSPGDTVCTGTTVIFTPAPTNGGTAPVYQWSVNGTNVATTSTYTFIPANGDVVGVTMTSNAVCPLPASVSHTLVMHVQPFAHPSLTLTAHPGDTVCQGTVADISINPVYGGNAPTYIWMKNGVNVSTASGYLFLPVNNDVIYVIMNSNYPCRLDNIDTSANLVMKIDTPMMPVVSIATTPNTMVQLGTAVTMTASVVNGGAFPTYQWVKNSIPVMGATNAVFTYTTTVAQAADSISCQVTSSGYCSATAHQWVFIQVAKVGVGQLNNSIADISVVPNPNKGDFVIKGTVGVNNEEVNLELTDVLGQVVYTSKVTAAGGKLNEHVVIGSKLVNGMYILSVRTAEDSKVFHMVIEQ